MANITKTPAKTYKAIIRRRGPTVMKTFRTKGDAKDWARQVEDQMVRGAYIDRVGAERLSLEKALERYLREVTPTKRPTTARREHLAADVLTDRLGEYSLAALSPDLIANYRDERLSEGKSPDTVRIELALLSHLYTIAIREWQLGLLYSPVANIRKPTPGRGRNRRLTPDEELRLLEACRALPNPTLGWLVRTALHTTMRAGELLTLQKDQVDLPRRIVRLEQTKNGSARTVPLSRAAVATLREAPKHPARPEETSLVFPGEPGKDGQRRPYQFHCVWSRILKRAGITGLRFHDLRHEAVSRLVEAGLSDQEVAAISGHRTMQMLKRYTHLRAEDLVARLDQAIPYTAPTRIRRRKGTRAEASRAA